MTYSEYFYSNAIFQYLIVFLSYVAQAFAIINIILISICFLGKDAKVNKKTWIFPCILIGIGFVITVFDIIAFLVQIREHGNELFVVPVLEADVLTIVNTIITCIVYVVVFFTGVLAYQKKKIISGLETVVAVYLIQTYYQLIIMYAIAYFKSDVWNIILLMTSGLVQDSVNQIYVFIYLSFNLILFIVLYFGIYKKERFMYVSWKYRIIFLVWEFMMIFIPALTHYEELTSEMSIKRLDFIVGLFIVLSGIVLPILIFILAARRYAVEKTIIQEEYISSELEYINQYKKSQEETRAFRHDIANNLSLLAAMMDEGKSEEAKEYLDGLLGDVRGMSPKYVTGDEMLDCIVGMKASRMDEEEIDFKLDGMIDGGLGMKPVDVCNIFANALDNAIEACERIPEKTDRWVSLLVKRTDKFFSIKLSNSVKEEKNGISLDKLFDGISRKTSKKDKNLHGFGTLNMKKALEKYGGMLKSEQEGDAFTVSIMIPR